MLTTSILLVRDGYGPGEAYQVLLGAVVPVELEPETLVARQDIGDVGVTPLLVFVLAAPHVGNQVGLFAVKHCPEHDGVFEQSADLSAVIFDSSHRLGDVAMRRGCAV